MMERKSVWLPPQNFQGMGLILALVRSFRPGRLIQTNTISFTVLSKVVSAATGFQTSNWVHWPHGGTGLDALGNGPGYGIGHWEARYISASRYACYSTAPEPCHNPNSNVGNRRSLHMCVNNSRGMVNMSIDWKVQGFCNKSHEFQVPAQLAGLVKSGKIYPWILIMF